MVKNIIDYDVLWQYPIRFWGIRYEINFIILAYIGVKMVDVDGLDTNNIDTKNNWPILRFWTVFYSFNFCFLAYK